MTRGIPERHTEPPPCRTNRKPITFFLFLPTACAALCLTASATTSCGGRGGSQCSSYDTSLTDQRIAEISAAAYELFVEACAEPPWDPNLTYFGTPELILQFRLELESIGCEKPLEEDSALCFLRHFADVWVIRSPSAQLKLSRIHYFEQWDETWVEFDQLYDGVRVTPDGSTVVVINGDNEVTQVQSGFRPNIQVVNQGVECASAALAGFNVARAAVRIAIHSGVDAMTLHLEELEDVIYYPGSNAVNEAWAAKLVWAWGPDGGLPWSEHCGFHIYVDVETSEPLEHVPLCDP